MSIDKKVLKAFRKTLAVEPTKAEKAEVVKKLKEALKNKSYDTINIGLK